MTDRYFSVVLPVPTEAFTYRGDETVSIGDRVEVELGKRAVIGYVVAEADSLETAKPIFRRIDAIPLFSRETIALTKQLARRTFSPRYRCMETAVPAGLKTGQSKVKGKTRRVLSAKLSPSAAEKQFADDERIRSFFALLHDHPLSLTVSDAARRMEITPARIKTLIKNQLVIVNEVADRRDPFRKAGSLVRDKPRKLNGEQQEALNRIIAGDPPEVLLMGITGSGKTEVYLQAIETLTKDGGSAIVLVPEISLTPQAADRFRSRFGEIVAILHSALSAGERFDEWMRIRKGEATVVVGARSAIFAPVDDLRLVVIDEAHESTYKQNESPRYNAFDVARERCALSGARLVLGTATPLCEHAQRTKAGSTALVQLKRRVENRPLPVTEIVDMRDELAAGNRSILSRKLKRELTGALDRGEQAILFLNRRGHSAFVMCRTCGLSLKCPLCAVSLTVHGTSRMICHYCNHRATMPSACPTCGSRSIKPFGAGTEKIEQDVAKIFPDKSVVRMDADTTVKKGSHRDILSAFAAGEHQILVGTQMIGKGLDIPNVTLVGVLAAESSLHLPDFRAAERTFAQLVQVCGRAGRHDRPGRAIIQTYSPDHYAIQLAAAHDVTGFLRAELKFREKAHLPPFRRIIQWLVESENQESVIEYVRALATYLRDQPGVVAGPAPAPIERLRSRYRWQVRWIFDPGLPDESIERVVKGAPRDAKLKIALDVDPFDLL